MMKVPFSVIIGKSPILDLAGGGVHEAGPDEDRHRVGEVALTALLDGVLGLERELLVVGVEFELEAKSASEVGDGADVGEGLAQTLAQEAVERLALDGDEVGQLEDLLERAEGIPLACRQRDSLSQGWAIGDVAGGGERRGNARRDCGRDGPEGMSSIGTDHTTVQRMLSPHHMHCNRMRRHGAGVPQ
jgi:hypothetical protein